MNRKNFFKYKGAIIEYSCTQCNLGGNFYHEFTKASKVNPGNCEHFDINFLYSAESNSMKFCPSLTCRNCKKNNIIELINEKTKNEIGSINYKCPQCGMGNITIGYLFQNEEINLDPLPNNAQQNNQIFNIGQNKKKIQQNIPKKISLIFVYNNKEYKINAEEEWFLPEAFNKLFETHNELKNLDIKCYKKDDTELSQFRTIQKLNLKNGDKISIELKPELGWN